MFVSKCLLRLGVLRVFVLFCVFVFYMGHCVMVPLNLTYLHCLRQFSFEHFFNLYYVTLEGNSCNCQMAMSTWHARVALVWLFRVDILWCEKAILYTVLWQCHPQKINIVLWHCIAVQKRMISVTVDNEIVYT